MHADLQLTYASECALVTTTDERIFSRNVDIHILDYVCEHALRMLALIRKPCHSVDTVELFYPSMICMNKRLLSDVQKLPIHGSNVYTNCLIDWVQNYLWVWRCLAKFDDVEYFLPHSGHTCTSSPLEAKSLNLLISIQSWLSVSLDIKLSSISGTFLSTNMLKRLLLKRRISYSESSDWYDSFLVFLLSKILWE